MQIRKDADILIDEALKATSKGCHHGIRQLVGHSLPHRRCNLAGGHEDGALQRQPFGSGSSVNVN